MFVRMCLLSWRPNWIHSFLKTRLLWLPPRVAFFLTSETSVVIARVSVFSFWHHSLSLLRRPLPFRQQHSLSTQKVTRFISLLINPHRPAPFATASCARSEDRALSLLRKPTLQQAGQLRGRRQKGPADVDRSVIQSRRLCVPSPWGSAPSSTLSLRPRRRLRSSSSAALAS
jgi:hypothetical protein